MHVKRIAILASGSGSNAEAITRYFQQSDKGTVVIIGSNKANAYVLERAQQLNVPSMVFSKQELEEGTLVSQLQALQIDFVVLAGFLLKIPENLIQAFPDKIVNIHPALLPKFGGKGMYGIRVHEAVKAAGETHTGITIHLVNEQYDDGKIIFQAAVEVLPEDTPEQIAEKVHQLEYKYFPNVIESLL